MLEFLSMKALISFLILAFCTFPTYAQSNSQKIYETERAFEKMVAEKGINQGFIKFLAPDGVMFFPEASNGREVWKSRPASPAALTWNPIWIDVSSNGALAYSIGNSVYRAKGRDDPTAYFGHYLSVWVRQPNGEYRAVLDTGINHEKPTATPTEWKSPADSGKEKNEKGLSAADSATSFFEVADRQGSARAYKMFLADNAFVMRQEKLPFIGKKAALEAVTEGKPRIKFAKRKSFIEAADLAYVHNIYSITDKAGTEIEKGNFVQVWKLRGDKWQIVVDVFVPIPTAQKASN